MLRGGVWWVMKLTGVGWGGWFMKSRGGGVCHREGGLSWRIQS